MLCGKAFTAAISWKKGMFHAPRRSSAKLASFTAVEDGLLVFDHLLHILQDGTTELDGIDSSSNGSAIASIRLPCMWLTMASTSFDTLLKCSIGLKTCGLQGRLLLFNHRIEQH